MRARYKTEEKMISLCALLVALAAFSFYWHRSELLLYGDAVAHVNIARRVVDSLTPGPLQLGTVWLPLPHILMLPLVWWDQAWQTGFAGSVPSLLAFLIGVRGVFRLVSIFASRMAALIASITFGLNPSLLYLQSTAMTEASYLAAMVWACTYFVEFWVAARHADWQLASAALPRAGLALLAATLTRYDGWFLGGCIVFAVMLRWARLAKPPRRALLRPMLNFLLITSLAPAAWLVYNFSVYGNALEFATGSYSARAIAERTTRAGDPPYPGHHHLRTAGLYFLKAARLNTGEGPWQSVMFGVATFASLIAIVDRRFRPALILWAPLPFYAWSIAYGGVPIFIPEWWPFSFYNVRYGIQLLPALAIFVAIAYEIFRRVNWRFTHTAALPLLVIAVIAGSYTSVWRATPIVLREALADSKGRLPMETALATQLMLLPTDSRLLAFVGSHSGSIQKAGIPYRRILHEGNFNLWQAALHQPASASYVIASDGDPVAAAVQKNPDGLVAVTVLQAPGQARTVIYKSIVSAAK
jgi:hypothetical protein